MWRSDIQSNVIIPHNLLLLKLRVFPRHAVNPNPPLPDVHMPALADEEVIEDIDVERLATSDSPIIDEKLSLITSRRALFYRTSGV